jgi:cell division cycle 20-like protein 1 (cofactor of APC complex)
MTVRRSPKVTYSDRFIPSRAASSRLEFSVLDREAAASETPRRAAEKEESNGAYNMLLRTELLGCPAAPVSPEKSGGPGAGGGVSAGPHALSPSKRCGL